MMSIDNLTELFIHFFYFAPLLPFAVVRSQLNDIFKAYLHVEENNCSVLYTTLTIGPFTLSLYQLFYVAFSGSRISIHCGLQSVWVW